MREVSVHWYLCLQSRLCQPSPPPAAHAVLLGGRRAARSYAERNSPGSDSTLDVSGL